MIYLLIIPFLLLSPSLLYGGPVSPPSPSAIEPQERASVVLGVGEQRFFHFSSIQKYSIGSKVIRVLPFSKSSKTSYFSNSEGLLIKAVAPGMGDLWVWKKDGTFEHRTIRVEKISTKDHARILESALGRLDEVEVIYTGKGAVLRGEVLSMKESARISALIKDFSQEVRDETTPAPELLDLAENRLIQWLQRSRLSTTFRVEKTGSTLWLKGHTAHSSGGLAIERQALAIYPLLRTEIEAFPDQAPTVYFKVFLFELKKSQFHNLGLDWPAQTTGAFRVTAGSIQDLLQIDLTLKQLEGNGAAKVLSNPELVVRAPGEAELFAGGELPIEIHTRSLINVIWKNYGLTLRLKVTHTAGDRVRLDIFTEVSHLKAPQSEAHIPGIQSNRMKTQVDARYGTPLFLSGLLQQGIREEARGIPFLRGIPVLGPLFGSEDYLNERSELVALLYPLASPPSAQKEFQSLSLPKGPIPLPRDWITPRDLREIQMSPSYPWNALEGDAKNEVAP